LAKVSILLLIDPNAVSTTFCTSVKSDAVLSAILLKDISLLILNTAATVVPSFTKEDFKVPNPLDIVRVPLLKPLLSICVLNIREPSLAIQPLLPKNGYKKCVHHLMYA